MSIFGMGQVGVRLAAACLAAGHEVIGVDVNQRVAAQLMAGQPDDGEPEELTVVASAAERGDARVTTDAASCHDSNVVIICVPTPLSVRGMPDLSAVEAAARSVAANIHPGALVILESTVGPGTTETRIVPIFRELGHVAGVDFALAYSPERVDPGSRQFSISNTPKLVAGLTAMCLERAASFYRTIVVEVVPMSGIREAEMAKLLENTYRQVNIALVNEIAMICRQLDVDVWEVIRAAATKPFGFARFEPGPGVGGHCIAIDPSYLSSAYADGGGGRVEMIDAANRVNQRMPFYLVARAAEVLLRAGLAVAGASILLVGVAYKANVADVRESPATPIVRALRERQAVVSYFDPHVVSFDVDSAPVPRTDGSGGARFDLVLFLQHHDDVDAASLVALSPRCLDTRGLLHGPTVDRL